MFKIGIIQSSRGIPSPPPPPPPPPINDYIPDGVKWDAVIHELDPDNPPTVGDYFYYSTQQITGITSSIDLNFFYDPTMTYRGVEYENVFKLYYLLSPSDPGLNYIVDPVNYGFTYYPPLAFPVNVLNTYYLSFGVMTGPDWSSLASTLSDFDWAFASTAVVNNMSTEGTELDKFDMIIRYRNARIPPITNIKT